MQPVGHQVKDDNRFVETNVLLWGVKRNRSHYDEANEWHHGLVVAKPRTSSCWQEWSQACDENKVLTKDGQDLGINMVQPDGHKCWSRLKLDPKMDGARQRLEQANLLLKKTPLLEMMTIVLHCSWPFKQVDRNMLHFMVLLNEVRLSWEISAEWQGRCNYSISAEKMEAMLGHNFF